MTLSLRRRLDFLLGVPLVNLMGVWARKTSAPPSKPDRILVTKLAAIGDTALIIPVLKALREGYPQAEIHWLVSRINQDLAQRVPYVNRIFVLKEFHPVALFDLIRELKRQRYDIGIDFEQWSRTTALLIFLAGISFRIGFKTQGQCRSALFDCAYPRSNHQHEIENFAGLLSLLGVRTMDKELKLWEDPKAAEWAERKIGEDSGGRRGPVIIFHPGCGKGGRPREWPVLSYLQLAEALRKKLGEIHLIITGGVEDKGKSGFFFATPARRHQPDRKNKRAGDVLFGTALSPCGFWLNQHRAYRCCLEGSPGGAAWTHERSAVGAAQPSGPRRPNPLPDLSRSGFRIRISHLNG